MIRLVLDANVFVSALLKPGSNPDRIMQQVRAEQVTLLLSEAICAEYLRVLTYPKIAARLGQSPSELADFIERLRFVAVFVPGGLRLPPLTTDPSDTKYLECAVEGKADLIVSGDHHLLDLGTHAGIRIVDAATGLAIINRTGPRPGPGGL
jgi:putative PIN family toxin of toxin-antitoxin system